MSPNRKAAIKAADAAVADLKSDYATRLEAILNDIDASVESGDAERLTSLCHTLREEAGTMGWPSISKAAGWLRDLHPETDTPFDHEVCRVFAQSLRLFSALDGTDETEQTIKLLQQLNGLRKQRSHSNA